MKSLSLRKIGASARRVAGLRSGLSVIAAGVVFGLASGGAAQSETLGEALADAYTNSGLLEQNRMLLQATDEDAAQALAALRPIISWSAGATHSFDRSYSATGASLGTTTNGASATLTMSLLLYDFGATRLGLDIAKESVLLTRQQLLSIEQQVLYRAVAAYMEVRRAEETVQLRQANNRLLTQELRAANDRFEVGDVTRTDVAQAEAALAQARSGLTSAQGSLVQAQLEYEAAVGHRPGTLAPPVQLGRMPGNLAEAEAVAMRDHPSMNVARKQVTVAELRAAVAETSTKPTVNLSANYGLDTDLDSDAWGRGGSVSLGVQGPIYSGGQLASAKRQAVLNKNAAMANLHVVTSSVRQDVGTSFSNVQIARAATTSGQEQVRAAEVAFNGVREEASLGSRTTLDVLTQEQDLLDARVAFLSSQVDEVIARYALLASMGQLTAEQLNLAVQLYDPAAYYNMVERAPAGLSPQGRRLDALLERLGKD